MSTNDATPPHDEPIYSAADRHQRNAYLREFLPAMAGYGLVLALVLGFVDEDTTAAGVWILLPVIPLILAAVAIYRSVRRSDEYFRVLQAESMALAFGASMIAALAFGFLSIVDAAPIWGSWIVFATGMTTWGVTLGIRARG